MGTRFCQDGASPASSALSAAFSGTARTSGERATEVPVSVTVASPESRLTILGHRLESGIHTSESVSPIVGPAPVIP